MRTPSIPLGTICLLLVLAPRPTEAAPFIRGDVDGNGLLQLTDPVRSLGHLFLGSPAALDCLAAADANDDGSIEISDPIYLLGFLFLGGSPPPAPYPACGEDPEGLGCASYPSCDALDTEAPLILSATCTEIACPEMPLTLRIGGPLDIIRIDGCNSCTPFSIWDDRGVALLRIVIRSDGLEMPTTEYFDLQVPIEPSAERVSPAMDGVSVSAGDGIPSYFIPYPGDGLVVPSTIAPGRYIRTIVAVDAAGNETSSGVPVKIEVDVPFEVAGGGERDPAPAVDPADLAALVAGNTAFALDIYRGLDGMAGNLFISPYSISQALAMTYAGARNVTASEMAAALRFTLPPERLHPAFNRLDLELASRAVDADPQEGDRFQLSVANSLWGQRDYAFVESFLDALARNYGAAMNLLDFRADPEACRTTINDWVADRTEDRILDLIPSGAIGQATRLVLTNAIYFNASWMCRFDRELTRDGPFRLLDGSEISVPLMAEEATLEFSSGEGYQAVELPYVGGKVAMVVILPDAGRFAEIEASLVARKLGEILGGLSTHSVDLRLPKFRFECGSLSLKAALQALGMEGAFTDFADFLGITPPPSLFIADVLHKSFVSVDEDGTEAAAATAVIMEPTSVPEPVTMTVDRPFIFLIRDIPTGAVIFLGRVVNPS